MANWDFEFVCQLCYRHFTSKARGKQIEPYHPGKLDRRAQEVVDYHWAMRHPGEAIRPIAVSASEPDGEKSQAVEETKAGSSEEQSPPGRKA